MPKTFAPLTAQIRWRFHQIVFLVLLAGLLLVAFIALRRNDFILILSCGMILAYGSYIFIRTFSIFLGMSKRFTLRIAPERLRDLDEKSLPIYTILLPVYREPAILDQLLRAMEDLDYPKEKLDVKLLLEADDQDTRQKVHERPRPVWLDIVDVPQGTPKTKPRACNVGLTRAKGEFVVIFDAEDRPERDQLKKAVLAFRSLPEKTICLQAKLNCYNPEQNFLTRMFTLEYTAWFDLYLPGLHAIGAPIPLGGTSNHFRIGPLKAIGAWDPYNVTEDCDLGMRIARRGYDTQILDSTTWEEAASQWSAWYKQRTRWLKGYFQTVMVHTQYPRTAIREFGLYRFVLFLVVVGGQVGTLSLSPVTWILSAVWLCLRWPIMDAVRPWTYVLFLLAVTLGLSNFLFIAIHAIGAYFRKQKTLGLWSILFPFYWLLMSAATWRGFMQFFTDPFKWEKTPHGLATHESTERSRDQEKNVLALAAKAGALSADCACFSGIAAGGVCD